MNLISLEMQSCSHSPFLLYSQGILGGASIVAEPTLPKSVKDAFGPPDYIASTLNGMAHDANAISEKFVEILTLPFIK